MTNSLFDRKESSGYDELKTLVLAQMEQSGSMAELRALVKSQVLAATTDLAVASASQKVKCHEHGIPMLLIVLEFLEYFGLNRSAQILRTETDFHQSPIDREALAEQLDIRGNVTSSSCLLANLLQTDRKSDISDSIEADMARLRSLNAQIDAEGGKFDFAPTLRGSVDSSTVRLVLPDDITEEIEEHFEGLSSTSSL